jgi:hypothetical protein
MHVKLRGPGLTDRPDLHPIRRAPLDGQHKRGTFMKAAGLSIILALAAPAGAAGITYDCDTAADHFSELALPAGSSPFSVSGTLRLNTLAASKKFVAVSRIQIASTYAPGQSPASYAGFSLSALPVDPKKMPSGASAIQMIDYNVAGKEDEALPLSILEKPGTPQHFTLAYDGSNVAVTIGTQSKSFPARVSDPVVRIICSTGEFLITDLEITIAH